jgi:hypothetical protein
VFLVKERIFARKIIKNNAMATVLDKQTSDKVSFMVCIVPAFADAYKMNVQNAYFT